MYYYAVHTGYNKGIYSTWDECKIQVDGFKGAKYKKFNNLIEAQNFIADIQHIIIDPNTTIYGDGGFNKYSRPDAWGSVVNGFGVDILGHFTHLLTDMNLKEVNLPKGKRIIIVSNFSGVEQQNNGAELLAAVASLRIAINLISSGITVKTIFCDSQVVLYWSIRLKDEQRKTFDPRKVLYIDELINLRKTFESMGGNFTKIDGDNNLADLGYHK